MKTLVAVLGTILLFGSAYAQSLAPSQSADTVAAEKADAKADARVEKHIKELRAKLKITPTEESQWRAVAQVMRNNVVELDKAIDKREASIGSATAVDDLNAYADIAQTHADSVKKLSAAFAPLYAAMSDDQKMVADAVFSHPRHGMKK